MDPNAGGKLFADPKFTIDEPWENYGGGIERATAVLSVNITDHLQTRTFVGYNNYNDNWVDVYVTGFQPGNVNMNREAEHYWVSSHSVTFQEDVAYDAKIGPVDSRLTFGADQVDNVNDYEDPNYLYTPINIYAPVYGTLPTTLDPSATSYANGSGRPGSTPRKSSSSLTTASTCSAGSVTPSPSPTMEWRVSGISPNTTATFNDNSKVVSRYSALVHPTPNTTVYAAHLESFIFNSGTTSYGVPLVPSLGSDNEYGFKGEFLDGTVRVTLTHFDVVLSNIRIPFQQGPGDPNPGFPGVKQTGEQSNPASSWAPPSAADRDRRN